MSYDEKRKYLSIPIELIRDKRLNWVNKALLSEIINLSKLEKGCIASNEHFAQLLGFEDRSTASKRITKLQKLGYIITNNIYDKRRCVGRIIQVTGHKSDLDNDKINDDSSENHQKNVDTTNGSSTENQGIVPETDGGSSNEDTGVVPERPEGGSKENTNNTYNNTIRKKQENNTDREQVLEQDTGASDTGANSKNVSSLINNIKYEYLYNTALMSRDQHRAILNDLYFNYPNWEQDLVGCNDVDEFIYNKKWNINNKATTSKLFLDSKGVQATEEEIRDMYTGIVKQYFKR